MDVITTRIHGGDAIRAKIRELKGDAKFKGGRFALRKAALLVAGEVKRRAQRIDDPETGTSIADNIAVRFSGRTFRKTGNPMYRVGVLGGARPRKDSERQGLPGGNTTHWRFIEFGTERARAQPFMRPALATKVGPAIDEFVTQYGKALDRAIKRAGKK